MNVAGSSSSRVAPQENPCFAGETATSPVIVGAGVGRDNRLSIVYLRGVIARALGLPLALALCACAAFGCASDDGASVDSDFALEGSVRDDLTDDPLSGAKVIFVSDTLDTTETRTDGRGRYAMTVTVREGVRLGTLHAEHSGYETSPAQTVYFDGTARVVHLRLRAK